MIVIWLFLISSFSWAVSEEEIARSVVQHFPLVEESALKAQAAEAEVMASEGSFDHKLKFNSRNKIEDIYDNQYIETSIERITPFKGLTLKAGHRQGVGKFPEYDGDLRTSPAGEVFAGFIMPLLQGFQTDIYRTNLQVAKLQSIIAQAELQLKQFMSVHKALSLYYKVLFLNQRLKVTKEVLDIALERQEMLKKRVKAGDLEELKLMDNERSIDKRRDEVAKAIVDLQDAKTQLSLYYRDQEGKPIIVSETILPKDGDFPVPPLPVGLEDLPQLKILKKNIDIGKAWEDFYRQTRLPELNLELVGAKELSQKEPYDPNNIKVGLRFSFPLENRKARGKTIATEYKNQALQRQLVFMSQNLKRELDFSFEAMKATKDRWNIISSELEKALKLAEAERSKWLQGASDLYIVTLREQDAAETNIKRWYAWLKYQQYLLDTKLYSGTILSSAQ